MRKESLNIMPADVVDRIWLVCLSPAIILGGLANKYAAIKQVLRSDELFQYYAFELPEDKDCNDLRNKKRWMHKYRKGKCIV